jgi:pimeloyl-ACP methyl ester carboxylesterase
MVVHTHGAAGPMVIALHGGPAAVGSAAPIARGLAHRFRVLEPHQRGSGDQPLTVATHVADLDELIAERCEGARPALVGESWGAMLALAYAAAHPERVGPVALVGCGTFDLESRARMRAIVAGRQDDAMRERLARIEVEVADPDERLRRTYDVTRSVYDFDPVNEGGEGSAEAEPDAGFDMRAHTETWEDMLRLQAEGVYPAAFAAVRSPVLMLHGDYDPHPGPMIRDVLRAVIPQLGYVELARCGHSPWGERQARDAFFGLLTEWLAQHTA